MRNIKTYHPYTALYYSNPKICMFLLHAAAIIRLYILGIFKNRKQVAIWFTFLILLRNEGSNPSGRMDVHLFNWIRTSNIKEYASCACYVRSGHCDELITRSEESYQLCVCVSNCCDLETSTMVWPLSDLGCRATVKNYSKYILRKKFSHHEKKRGPTQKVQQAA